MLRIILRLLAVFGCVMLFFSMQAGADEIVMENSNTLTGTITTIENGILTLTTDYSDPIKIQTSKITHILTDDPVEVHLDSGEVLKGKISSTNDGNLTVGSSTDREPAVINWNRIKSVNPPRDKWTGSITLGANLQTGNTDRANASFGANATHKTERDRFNLHFLFNYAEEDDKVSARNTYGTLKYDYFFTEKVYGYLAVDMLSDEFKDLNLRTVAGPGVGYQVWDTPARSLSVDLGLAYFSEDLDKGEDSHWLTARLASSLRWKIFGPVTFSDTLVVYPSLEDVGEYQLRNEASIISPLVSSWSLKFSNIIERDSDPSDGVRKNDLFWLLGLQYGF